MTLQGGRFIARLHQLQAQCFGARRTFLSSTYVERVPAPGILPFSVNDSHKHINRIFATSIASRTYATRPVSRPKAHTGRTTSTRKTPTTSATKAAKVPKAKTTTPKALPKAKSKAKPRARAKPKTKSKTKSKKKAKAKSKAKPKPKKRKVLTEKQKEQKAIRAQRDKIAELKETALTPPHGTPWTAWTVFVDEMTKRENLGVIKAVKEASPKFKQLSPEQLEVCHPSSRVPFCSLTIVQHYNHIANQNKEKNEKAYRQFIESHTPLQIYEANLARNQLKKLSKSDPKKPNRLWIHLNDERQVKRPSSAFIRFYIDRQTTNDYKGMTAVTRSELVSREWKALTAAEKKVSQVASKGMIVTDCLLSSHTRSAQQQSKRGIIKNSRPSSAKNFLLRGKRLQRPEGLDHQCYERLTE